MTKHQNSMDDIIIRYGIPQRSSSEKSKEIMFKVLIERKSREQALKETQAAIKEIPLSEFLKIKKENLSQDEQKVQEVLKSIYLLNDSEFSIYHRFPKREKPLLIDTTFIYSEKGADGAYFPEKNEINLSKIEKMTSIRLLEVFSHELKHAQQYMANGTSFNNYQQHQLGFLEETQANACTDRVLASLHPEHPRARNFNRFKVLLSVLGEGPKGKRYDEKSFNDWLMKNVEERWTMNCLKFFLTSEMFRRTYEYYKDSYDRDCPIGKMDTPLTKIPPEFDIIHPEGILDILRNYVPKQARLPYNKVQQAITNNDTQALSVLLKGKDAQGNLLINNESIHEIGLKAFFNSEKINSTEIFETFLKSGRCSKEDIEDFFSYALHLPEGQKLTNQFMQTRGKLLKILLSQKTPKGKRIISPEKLKKEIALSKDLVSMSDSPEDAKKLIEYAEEVVRSMTPSLHKTLKKKQITPKKKTTIKSIQKKSSALEV